MERRQMLKCLFAGGVSAALTVPALAQQGPPRPHSSPPRMAATPGAARPNGNVMVATPAELEAVLQEWEEKTAVVKRLRGSHQRYIYDGVFGVEKRSVGEFWHEAPDKGRIDFEAPSQLPDPPINTKKKTTTGQPYEVQADQPLSWVCNGQQILQVEHTPKTYGLAEIPLEQQGENMMDGPLPFLFGMKADKIKRRYRLSLGDQNGKTGGDGRKVYHIVALPLLQADARNWQRAEVLLDAQYCLPNAIRLIAPDGATETVYVFPLSSMKANESVWWKLNNPFKMSLRGYKLVEKETAPQRQKSKRPVLPVNGTATPLGRASLRDSGHREN